MSYKDALIKLINEIEKTDRLIEQLYQHANITHINCEYCGSKIPVNTRCEYCGSSNNETIVKIELLKNKKHRTLSPELIEEIKMLEIRKPRFYNIKKWIKSWMD